jgi:hypothetical protein
VNLKTYLVIVTLSLTSDVWASSDNPSAYREPDTHFSHYIQDFNDEIQNRSLVETPLRLSKKFIPENELPKATAWTNKELLQERFEKLRDMRFLNWKRGEEFPRRLSWMFPDDGCYARAALFNRNAFREFIPIPKKVFAFGNLRAETDNSPRGVVTWWYHVAPIVEVDSVKYVLDPALEPNHPLELKEWLDLMGTPEKIKVSICSSGTYTPSDNCSKESDGLELRAERAQAYYLNLEWKRLERLGRQAEVELGDSPPWKKESM